MNLTQAWRSVSALWQELAQVCWHALDQSKLQPIKIETKDRSQTHER